MDKLTAEDMNKLDTWKLHGYEQKVDAIEKRLAKIDHSIDILIELHKQTRKDIDVNHDKLTSFNKMLVRIDEYVFSQKKANFWSENIVPLSFALCIVWVAYRFIAPLIG